MMTPEERFTKIENSLETVTENQAKHDAAVQDLIRVSRALIESQVKTDVQIKELGESIKGLRKAQKETDEKLHALIETVDRIIRHQAGT
jgi:hypothetical protein